MSDIRLLEEANVLDQGILAEVRWQFAAVLLSAGDDVDDESFTLEDVGPIIVLEQGDNLRDLREIGLDPGRKGLLGAGPEWCALKLLGTSPLYNLCVALNNSWAVNIILKKGDFDAEIEQWLAEQVWET